MAGWRDGFQRYVEPTGALRMSVFALALARFETGRLVDLIRSRV